MAGLPHEDPAGDGLVLGGVLPDDEQPRAAVEPLTCLVSSDQ
jgi:hypothetical protein